MTIYVQLNDGSLDIVYDQDYDGEARQRAIMIKARHYDETGFYAPLLTFYKKEMDLSWELDLCDEMRMELCYKLRDDYQPYEQSNTLSQLLALTKLYTRLFADYMEDDYISD